MTDTPIERGVPYWPRGLSRLRAAAYVGATPQAFDRMVADGWMPKSTNMEGRWLWDRFVVDKKCDLIFGTDSQGREIIEFESTQLELKTLVGPAGLEPATRPL